MPDDRGQQTRTSRFGCYVTWERHGHDTNTCCSTSGSGYGNRHRRTDRDHHRGGGSSTRSVTLPRLL